MSRVWAFGRLWAVVLAVCLGSAGADGGIGLAYDANELLQPGAEAAPKPAAKPPASQPVPDQPAPQQIPEPQEDLLAGLFGRSWETAPSARLAGTPNMFGDFFNLGGDLVVSDFLGTATTGLPLAGGSRRAKVGENNKALPQDRAYLLYNHFHNALDVAVDGFGGWNARRSISVDRYTLGVEKTLLDREWSVEARMPLTGTGGMAVDSFGISAGEVGNLAVIVKRKVFQTCTSAAAIGLLIDTPTGSDARGFAYNTRFAVRNEAVHLGPFAGIVAAPSERLFWQAFAQIDVPANGNSVDIDDPRLGAQSLGVLQEQTALYADLSLGYWVYRNPCARPLTGLAPVFEIHYATALQDADSVRGIAPPTRFLFTHLANRVDEVNATLGLHLELGPCTFCRVGGVTPLSGGDDRSFDSELQVQLERRF